LFDIRENDGEGISREKEERILVHGVLERELT